MERILGPEYTPNEEDVLQSYVRTTDIVETSFRVDRLIYRCVGIINNVRNIIMSTHILTTD